VGSRVNARFEYLFLAFQNYCVKVNTDRPISQQPSCSSGTLVSGSIKIMQGFSRKETSNASGVARHAHVQLPSYAEAYARLGSNEVQVLRYNTSLLFEYFVL